MLNQLFAFKIAYFCSSVSVGEKKKIVSTVLPVVHFVFRGPPASPELPSLCKVITHGFTVCGTSSAHQMKMSLLNILFILFIVRDK